MAFPDRRWGRMSGLAYGLLLLCAAAGASSRKAAPPGGTPAVAVAQDPVDTANHLPCPTVAITAGPAQQEIIPLQAGLTIVDAWHSSLGDLEIVETVTSTAPDSIHLSLLGELGAGAEPNRTERTICREELRTSRLLYTGFVNGDPDRFPGTTLFSLSTAVFNDLKTRGRASLTYTQPMRFDESTASRVDVEHDGKTWDEWIGDIARVESDDVQVPLIVNDQRVTMPAIHARGTLGQEPMEFLVADDPQNPVTLRFTHPVSNFSIQVVRISFEAPGGHRIEDALKTNGSAETHGIYFDFASARLRPESAPVLREIAAAMKGNPQWKLQVAGHTDNIGSDQFNLDLSLQRAEAVKAELVDNYGVSPSRLTTAGFGASRPKENNDTLEGRARNRRVELVRQEVR